MLQLPTESSVGEIKDKRKIYKKKTCNVNSWPNNSDWHCSIEVETVCCDEKQR